MHEVFVSRLHRKILMEEMDTTCYAILILNAPVCLSPYNMGSTKNEHIKVSEEKYILAKIQWLWIEVYRRYVIIHTKYTYSRKIAQKTHKLHCKHEWREYKHCAFPSIFYI